MEEAQPHLSKRPVGKRVSLLIVGPSMHILGGQAVQVHRLLGILEDVPDIEVTFLPIDPRPPKFLFWVLSIRGLRTVVTFAQYIVRLAWRIPQHEVIHIFSAGLTSYALWTLPALLLGRLWRKKIILNYHDGQGDQHLTEWRTAKPSIALADRIITPSGFLVDVFRKHGIKARAIFNIIDTSRFIYRKRRKLRPIFMTNRILEPLYNVECILRLFDHPGVLSGRHADNCSRRAVQGISRKDGARSEAQKHTLHRPGSARESDRALRCRRYLSHQSEY